MIVIMLSNVSSTFSHNLILRSEVGKAVKGSRNLQGRMNHDHTRNLSNTTPQVNSGMMVPRSFSRPKAKVGDLFLRSRLPSFLIPIQATAVVASTSTESHFSLKMPVFISLSLFGPLHHY